ncbi:MAG: hypothetical protein CMA60_05790 [Euryarchaeota archaeon]|nr:hypothetical protein [Euryarchaeota archaeon]
MKNRICESKQAGRFWEKSSWGGADRFELNPTRLVGKHAHEKDPVIWGPSFGTEAVENRKAMYYVWRNHRAMQLDWNYRRYPDWRATAAHQAKTGRFEMPLKADWAKKHAGVFETVEEAIEFANSLMED